MKKILYSAGLIVFVAALALGATGAFFSDTETSTGNTFTAGAIDLKIDNESYAIDHNIPGFNNPQGNLVASENTSWGLADLTIQKFFNFVDLKPGDLGEDTISIHVNDNDAWLCAAAQITSDTDNGFTEPEDEVFGTNSDNDDGTVDGDLDSGLQFAFWVDDGDNVLESCGSNNTTQNCVDETENIFISGTLADIGAGDQIALADSVGGILGAGNPIPGGSDFFIGKAWCFGSLSQNPLEQDGGDQGRSPINGTGAAWDGSNIGNFAHTDQVIGDLQFYAEQSRNNGEFLCSKWTPRWPEL